MPPTHTDEGLRAAQQIRALYPTTSVVLLSQYLEPRYAQRLLADQPGGLGYLLKERVSDIAVLVDAMRRVTEGECVIDPTIITRLDASAAPPRVPAGNPEPPRAGDPGAGGRGQVKRGCRRAALGISERTVEASCAQVFRKLGLEPDPDLNRRVLAVLTLLNG